MSFILDALKKSERERERQQQPAVLELPYGRRNRSQPLWLLIVIGLLVVNFVLLLVMWWRSGQSLAPTTTGAVTSTSASSAPIRNEPGNSAPIITPPRASDVRPLQSEAGVEAEPALDETAALLAEDEVPADEPLVRPLNNLERAVAQQELSANAQRARSPGSPPTSSNVTDSTPTLASLGGSGALNLPELRLDVHVYSSVASERFAFINTRKYSEGQTLAEGPRLEKIAQDGVILSYRNQRFLVPRN